MLRSNNKQINKSNYLRIEYSLHMYNANSIKWTYLDAEITVKPDGQITNFTKNKLIHIIPYIINIISSPNKINLDIISKEYVCDKFNLSYTTYYPEVFSIIEAPNISQAYNRLKLR